MLDAGSHVVLAEAKCLLKSHESVTGSHLLLVYDHTPVDNFRALMSFIC